jgi:DNA-binding LacI/PurR family transcriptional regulator
MASSKDVAKRAGVSQATVSRVMNDPSKVNPELVKKVKQAMEELNYRPNSIARSLVNQKTNTIALISGTLHNSFFAETITTIVCHARKRGYNVNVHIENDREHTGLNEDVVMEQVDGILASSILLEDTAFEKLSSMGVPFVMLNRHHKNGGYYAVMDNYQAGQLAAQHLIDLGHRSLGWIGGSLKASTFYGRYHGFRDTLMKYGLQVEDEFFKETDTSKSSVITALEKMLAFRHRPTAIFAATDSMAITVMDYLDSTGYSIPEDISLVGLDDLEMSGHSRIQLTTVRVKGQQSIGLSAIKMLIDLMEKGSTDNNQIVLPAELVIRKTTSKIM